MLRLIDTPNGPAYLLGMTADGRYHVQHIGDVTVPQENRVPGLGEKAKFAIYSRDVIDTRDEID